MKRPRVPSEPVDLPPHLSPCQFCRRARVSAGGCWIGCLSDELGRATELPPIAVGYIGASRIVGRTTNLMLLRPNDAVSCGGHVVARYRRVTPVQGQVIELAPESRREFGAGRGAGLGPSNGSR